MKRKVLVIFIMFLICKSNVLGITYAECSSSTISRLKSLISNINISYSYRIENNTAYYDVTLTNVPEDVYFIDLETSKEYRYWNTINGEITIKNYTGKSGKYKFYSALVECYGVSLGDKYYNFPIYNIHYNDPLCDGISNFSLCKKWVNKLYSSYEFQKRVSTYKASLNDEEIEEETIIYEKTLFDKIVEFYVKYYYLVLGVIIILCWTIIVINKRKNSFKL